METGEEIQKPTIHGRDREGWEMRSRNKREGKKPKSSFFLQAQQGKKPPSWSQLEQT